MGGYNVVTYNERNCASFGACKLLSCCETLNSTARCLCVFRVAATVVWVDAAAESKLCSVLKGGVMGQIKAEAAPLSTL